MIFLLVATMIDDFQPIRYPDDPPCAQDSTYGVAICLRSQGAVWERRLKTAYRAAVSRVDPAAKPKLRDAQRMWIRYREANCAVYANHGGTISVLLSTGCWRDMSKARTIELTNMD